MNKMILKQLQSIKREIRDIEKEICDVQNKINILEQDKTHATVVGSRPDLTIGPITIRGYRKGYGNKIEELKAKKRILNQKRKELLQTEKEAEEYIFSIQDSSVRRIMKYRYIDGLTWQQVAVKMGPKYTADGCRMTHKRFMFHD